MKKQVLVKILTVALAVGALMFASPAVSQAVTITSVTVNMGGTNVWCDTTSVCAADHKIWNLGGGVTITGSQALILTQVPGATPPIGFNFDTSDFSGVNAIITINGNVFTDNGNVLGNFNTTDTTTNNEAQEWSLPTINTLGGIKLWVGYADDAHTDPFTDGQGGKPVNGHPDGPWSGDAGVTFIGGPNNVGANGGCVRPGVTSCFDAGALRIEAAVIPTPEPSILLLLGSGLLAIAILQRKRAKNNA